jgi:hypothetical protein
MARQAVRQFLNFDMTEPKDIFFQDQLAWGVIESTETSRPMLFVQRSILNTMSDDVKEELEETVSALDGEIDVRKIAKPRTQSIKFSDTRSVIEGGSTGGGSGGGGMMAIRGTGNNKEDKLQNLLWETASMGGTSKLHKTKASQSRSILKKIEE